MAPAMAQYDKLAESFGKDANLLSTSIRFPASLLDPKQLKVPDGAKLIGEMV